MAPVLPPAARSALAHAPWTPDAGPTRPEAWAEAAWMGWRALLLDDDPAGLAAWVRRPRPDGVSFDSMQAALLTPVRAALPHLAAEAPSAAQALLEAALAWQGRLAAAQVDRADAAALGLASEAEASRAARATFLGHVGHEVRTPLSSILAFTQLLKAQGAHIGPEELAQCLDSLDEQAQRLMNLLDDVVELAHLDAGLAGPAPEDLDLWRLLRDVRQDASPGGGHLDISAGVRRYARVDGRRLARALRGVLRTAHRLSPEPAAVRARVDLDPQGNLRVRITDGGDEPLAVRRGWFAGFQGADQRQGLGPGLAIAVAARLLRSLGGELEVEARAGGPAAWVATVPLSELADVATTAETPLAPPRPLERLLVVAAPDTPRELLRELCGSLGVETRFVTIEELAEGASPRPDVILAEAHPPLAVLERVSATRGLEAIPVVVTGAFGGGPSRAELRQAGVFEVLERPLDLDELTTALMDAASFTPE
jgi:CheY-like chemotaxis protein